MGGFHKRGYPKKWWVFAAAGSTPPVTWRTTCWASARRAGSPASGPCRRPGDWENPGELGNPKENDPKIREILGKMTRKSVKC